MERTRIYVIKPVIFAELICEVLVMIVLFDISCYDVMQPAGITHVKNKVVYKQHGNEKVVTTL